MTASTVPVFLDCDTGIDDSLALAYLLRSPRARLVGVSTVSGNTDARQAAVNSLGLLALAGREDVPVAVGAHHFLEEDYAGGSPQVHGDNGIGGVSLPAGAEPVDEDPADLLLRLAREHGGELRLVAIGPLTNLALALRRYPELPSLLHSVTVMGGAALVPGNITAVAEANIRHDPAAAAEVVAADWDLTLVPLDVTMRHLMSEEHRSVLLASADPLARTVGEVLDHYFDFSIGHFGERTAAMHDPMAAAIAVGAVDLVSAPRVHVEVDTTAGPGRGQTVADLRGIYRDVHPDGARTRLVLSLAAPFAPPPHRRHHHPLTPPAPASSPTRGPRPPQPQSPRPRFRDREAETTPVSVSATAKRSPPPVSVSATAKRSPPPPASVGLGGAWWGRSQGGGVGRSDATSVADNAASGPTRPRRSHAGV
ncbi:nucleoside hydrolase [Rathayibacter tanaceti]|uniref:nucleoside hydrolase n=1 Tax=Rathayibacter tanaceti TaxID=1671680 RepID=UPI001F540158|nr:nucleoside hydrolase [Rathayibacter tanaceti]